MGDTRARTWPQRLRSVREDWLAWLPAEKDGLFDGTIGELESSYAMLSVALNEAFSLRAQGSLGYAREQAGISAELCDRLAGRLGMVLEAIEAHGRHFGTLPNVVALNPEFFRGETALSIARKNNLLSRVLFSSRSRFFHKLRALSDTVEMLQGEYRVSAEEIADGASTRASLHWEALEVLHYDLNTCLRETIVLLKSFLCALPNEEVQPFRQKLQAPGAAPIQVRHRRKGLFRRK